MTNSSRYCRTQRQVGADDETLTSRALGGVRYKVPPPQFEYNGDGTVEP